ncbi:MAG: thymidylate synthase [Pseudomonadota bacterium]
MEVLDVRNVHEALPRAIDLLQQIGVRRESRNGPVLVAPVPVTTVYRRPTERVLFWPERDANPFFHLYESLWMLAGRNDLAPLLRYVTTFGQFSDDGRTLSGAYGYRWRKNWDDDQLAVIARRLRENPDDRRCVLQMWDCSYDLDADLKDIPCNLVITFQRDAAGALDMTVFCRSNDIILGAYGANAVHFSMLQEYLALWIGCAVGRYWQVSVNWHAYLDTLDKLKDLPRRIEGLYSVPSVAWDPYRSEGLRPISMVEPIDGESGDETIGRVDRLIAHLLLYADTDCRLPYELNDDEPWADVVLAMFRAHWAWRSLAAPERFTAADAALARADQAVDWVVAGRQWLARRMQRWSSAMSGAMAR